MELRGQGRRERATQRRASMRPVAPECPSRGTTGSLRVVTTAAPTPEIVLLLRVIPPAACLGVSHERLTPEIPSSKPPARTLDDPADERIMPQAGTPECEMY